MPKLCKLIAVCCWLSAIGSVQAEPPPQRIVSTVPALTEMLFAIGAGPQVVGVTDYCDYPAEARQKAKIGGYGDLSFEKLISLKPDLVVAADYARNARQFCATAGLPLVEVKLGTLADVLATIEKLGRVTGHEPSAHALATAMEADLDKIRLASRQRPSKRALLVIGRMPGSFQALLTAGPGGFLNDLLTIAGGSNVLADVNQAWPQINLETVLARKPDVVIELSMDRVGRPLPAAQVAKLRADWEPFLSIPAVVSGRVSVLQSDHSLIPGPRLVDTARALSELLR